MKNRSTGKAAQQNNSNNNKNNGVTFNQTSQEQNLNTLPVSTSITAMNVLQKYRFMGINGENLDLTVHALRIVLRLPGNFYPLVYSLFCLLHLLFLLPTLLYSCRASSLTSFSVDNVHGRVLRRSVNVRQSYNQSIDGSIDRSNQILPPSRLREDVETLHRFCSVLESITVRERLQVLKQT